MAKRSSSHPSEAQLRNAAKWRVSGYVTNIEQFIHSGAPLTALETRKLKEALGLFRDLILCWNNDSPKYSARESGE